MARNSGARNSDGREHLETCASRIPQGTYAFMATYTPIVDGPEPTVQVHAWNPYAHPTIIRGTASADVKAGEYLVPWSLHAGENRQLTLIVPEPGIAKGVCFQAEQRPGL